MGYQLNGVDMPDRYTRTGFCRTAITDRPDIQAHKAGGSGIRFTQAMTKKKEHKKMDYFIGTKIIQGKPMNLGDYNKHRGWEIPENEDPEREGYHVVYEDGYQSWSPKQVFEKTYQTLIGMSFGLAAEAMNLGHKVMREGWNGKGICVYLVNEAIGLKRPSYDGEMCDVTIHSHYVIDSTGLETENKLSPKFVVPWVPSQTDLGAEDWLVIDYGLVRDGYEVN